MKRFARALIALVSFLAAFHANAQMTSVQRQELRHVNLLGNKNPGFENGNARWVNSGGGTFSTTSSSLNIAYGSRAGAWNPAAAGDSLSVTTGSLPTGALGAACQAFFYYKGSDSLVTAQVLDGSSNVLVSKVLATSSGYTTVDLVFSCPSSGSVTFKLLATGDAAATYVDQVFLGLSDFNPDVSPVVYSVSKSAIGSVGSAGQIVAGHELVAEDFPVTTGKIAFWNLSDEDDDSGALSCSSGSAACDLTNVGTVTFTGTGLDGSSNAAAVLDGSTQYLKSTDAFFNPGNSKSFALGCWIKADDYTNGTSQLIVGNENSGTDRGFYIFIGSDGSLSASATNTATAGGETSFTSAPLGWSDGDWHFTAAVFDHENQLARIYADDERIGTVAFANQRSLTSSTFQIGAHRATPTSFFDGEIGVCFFHNSGASGGALTDDDIHKLYAYKLTHARGVPVADQQWNGVYYRSDDKVQGQMMSDWLVAQTDNDVYWDLSGLASTSSFSARLMQNGFSSTIVPAATYQTGELTTAPTVPFSHGLPGRPIWVMVEQKAQIESGSWNPLDGVCWAKDDDQINCNFGSVTIDASHPIRIVASMIPGGGAVREAGPTRQGLVESYAYDVQGSVCEVSADYTVTNTDGCEKIMSDATAGNITINLPSASDSKGRRIYFQKTDSGSNTVSISGTISGGTSNNSIKAQYGTGIVFSDGSNWYWERDIEEKGQWTAGLGGTTGTPTASLSGVAYYQRQGRKVDVQFSVTVSSISGGSGLALLTGLPYQASAGQTHVGNVMFSGVDMTGSYCNLEGSPFHTYVFLGLCANDNASWSNVTVAGVSAGDGLRGSWTYKID